MKHGKALFYAGFTSYLCANLKLAADFFGITGSAPNAVLVAQLCVVSAAAMVAGIGSDYFSRHTEGRAAR